MNNSKEEHSYFVMPARRVSKSSGQRAVLVIHDKKYDAKDIHWEVQRSPRHPIYIVKAEPEKVKTKPKGKIMPKDKDLDPYVTRGLNVIARNEKDGLYYAGHVLITLNRKFAAVVFDNNEKQETMTKLIIPMGGSVPRPELGIGDFVLVRVLSVDAEKECYVPGRVRYLPQRRGDQMKFYTIIMYNGQECTTMRSHLVKIGQVRFYETVHYIAELQSLFSDEQKAEKEEKTQKSKSRSKSRSRSRSRSRSNTRRRSRSESKSRSRSRSESKSRSRSRSESKSRSRSRSESKSRSRSRSESKSRSRSRSESRSRSRSRSRSGRRSRSYSRSRSRSRSLSKSRSRSRSRNEDRKQGQSYSRSSSKSKSVSNYSSDREKRDKPASDRNGAIARQDNRENIYPSPTPVTQSFDENRIREIVNEEVTRNDIFVTDPDSKQIKLSELEKKLQEQQFLQEKQNNKLLKHARKINKMRKRMKLGKKMPIYQPAVPNIVHNKVPVLRELEEREEVLARWPDDGWYYWGNVSEKLKDQIYVIMDQTRHQEEIPRDHILTDSENTTPNLQHHDYVIAPHPEYKNSYAPGKVLSVRNREVEVKFYDDEVDEVDLGDVFAISSDQYDSDVRYIRRCEKDFIGRKVLTRNDDNGRYLLGKVLGFTGSDLQYKIQCSDGATISQRIVHIFNKENMKKITHLQEKDYVLAKPYGKSYYIPAVIERLTPPNVKFCDGSRKTGSDDCLWLNEDYYENAKNYYLARDRSQLDDD